MLKIILALIGLILGVSLLGAIPGIGTFLVFIMLIAIAICIIIYLIRYMKDIIALFILLLPHFLFWGIIAIVLATLFVLLY